MVAKYIFAQGMGDKPNISTIEISPIPKTEGEKKILDVLEERNLFSD